jgi:PIN domain nuclease of toxin-antitoxin system
MLAVLNGETGTDAVTAVLDDAVISSVNYSEVISKLVEVGTPPALARKALQQFGIGVIAFDTELAERTGALRAQTRHLGLSLADRACLSLAERERLPALTGDRRWADLKSAVDVRLFR